MTVAVAETASPPRLEGRPAAEAWEIGELLDKIRTGALRIPRFQRPFRWQEAHELELFDSVHRGFPIGTLLLWRHPAEAAMERFGALEIRAPARPDALWIVDGQQRLSTLAAALLRRPERGARAIFYDLETDRFVASRWEEPTAGVSARVPLVEMADTTSLQDWASERGYARDDRRRLVAVADRIRKYKIPAYVVEGDDERVLRAIYGRTNRAGLRLEEHEVFEALHGSLAGDEPSSIDSIVRGFEALAFGAIERSTVYQTLLAIEGLPLDEQIDLGRALAPDRASRALRQTADALRHAVTFLREDAGFPHGALVPYELPLIVLGRFFHVFPTPSGRTRILLRRWLWRGALALQLTGARVGKRQHVDAIREGDEAGSVHGLVALAGQSPAKEVEEVRSYRFSDARSKMQVCALASLAPCDLRTGEGIDVPALLAEHREEAVRVLVPRAVSNVTKVGLAGRFLHGDITPARLRDALRQIQDVKVLASHAVTERAIEALRAGDEVAFLEERTRTLCSLMRQYFARRAEWGADDSPSLDSLIVTED